MIKFVWKVIQLALFLGFTGQLVDATLSMAKMAAHAQQHQLRMGEFTRMLNYCDLGTQEYGSKKCDRYHQSLAKRFR
jgi:hypothetical protein